MTSRNAAQPKFNKLRDIPRHLAKIIHQQFTTFGSRPWFIPGIKGHVFIRRNWEEVPFVKTYYVSSCKFVGPYFAISFSPKFQIHDYADYGDGEWTDEEFGHMFQTRTAAQIVKTD